MEGRFAVAAETGGGRPDVTASHMTLKAGRAAVGPAEREAREVVIEGHLRPAVGCMAGAAILAELTAVAIIFPVAGHALCRRVHKLPRLMAISAQGLDVGAGKREDGLGVIEGQIDPLRRLMTASAILDELTGVHIGLEVALGAELGDSHPLAIDVACFAVRVDVAASQIESRKRMVE